MVHDELNADRWYHEFGNTFSKITTNQYLAIKMLKRGDSPIEVLTLLEQGTKHFGVCSKIIEEIYIEERRVELASRKSKTE